MNKRPCGAYDRPHPSYVLREGVQEREYAERYACYALLRLKNAQT